MSRVPPTPSQVHELLAQKGRDWWRAWDVRALQETCAAVPDAVLPDWPDVARWRALSSLMTEQADALASLELAYAGHWSRAQDEAACVDAHLALALCAIDVGASGGVTLWLERAGTLTVQEATARPENDFWLCAGIAARAIFGGSAGHDLEQGVAWLRAHLQPKRSALSPDECLITAQILITHYFLQGRFESFDALAAAVEQPGRLDAAAPLSQARWLHALGLAHYQIGNFQRAEQSWLRAITLADAHGLHQIRIMSTLVLLRLLIDRGRLADAQAMEHRIDPGWGAGREAQLMQLKQMSARLKMMQGHPVQALAILREALALADAAHLGTSELAGCHLDLAQYLLATLRFEEAEHLLQQEAARQVDRDAEVFACLLELLRAWQGRHGDPSASRAGLQVGLARAQRARYTMFFRLLPTLAADICALSLRWDVEAAFALEVVRSRALPAPADADERWPWCLYLRLIGGFDSRLRDAPMLQPQRGKVAKKPLELLRMLGCAPGLSLRGEAAADALWPEADGDGAGKNLEMTVQRLRRMLDDDDRSLVRVSDGRVSLDPTRVSSDVAQRRALVRQLEALALSQPTLPLCRGLVRRIVALSTGPLLPDAPSAPWLEAERARCARDLQRAWHAGKAALVQMPATADERLAFEQALAVLMGD